MAKCSKNENEKKFKLFIAIPILLRSYKNVRLTKTRLAKILILVDAKHSDDTSNTYRKMFYR